MNHVRQIVSVALISSVLGAAHAAGVPPAGVAATNLSVTVKLIDLAPDDGVAPSISFLSGDSRIYTIAEVEDTDVLRRQSSSGNSFFAPLVADRSGAGTRLQASVSTGADGVRQLTAALNQRVDQAGRYFVGSAEASSQAKFVLSAQTLVVFSMDAHVTGGLSGDHVAPGEDYFRFDVVQGGVNANVRALNPDGSGMADPAAVQNSSFGKSFSVDAYKGVHNDAGGVIYQYLGNGVMDHHETGFVSFMNPTASAAAAEFSASALVRFDGSTRNSGAIPAVPEPDAWLFGLVGVALCFGASRQR